MESNLEIVNRLSRPFTSEERETARRRKSDRYWKAASSAIAAKVLRQLRIKGMTRVQLAEELGITPANVTRYLNGTCNFELRTLVEIERVLGLQIIDRDIIPHKKEPVKVIIEYRHVYKYPENGEYGGPEMEIAMEESLNMLNYA